MDGLMLIGIVVLMIINLVLYHKIFNVLYFDLGKGLLKELIGAFFAAALEMAAITMLFGKVFGLLGALLGGILGILGWILRIALIIGAVAAVVCLIVWIVKMVKGKLEGKENSVPGVGNPLGGALLGANVQNMENTEKDIRYCAYCGKPIEENTTICSFCGKEKWVRNSN